MQPGSRDDNNVCFQCRAETHLHLMRPLTWALITEKGDLGLSQTLHVSSRPPWVPCDLWKMFDGPNGVVIDARSARPRFQSKVRAKFSHDTSKLLARFRHKHNSETQ